MTLSLILGLLSALGLALTTWQWIAGRRFPLHDRGNSPPSGCHPVTVLKPLRGADAETAACLQTWLCQDYTGPVQILFGVASEEDPAAAVVRELLPRHPEVDAALVHCPERLGVNGKVSNLIQLARKARHELLVVSDGDVVAPPDLLRHLVAPLAHPTVGLVHCFYRMTGSGGGRTDGTSSRAVRLEEGAEPRSLSGGAGLPLGEGTTFARRWEAVGVNIDFWSQVLQSKSLWPMDFALGAAMATSRSWLARMGEFDALADYLADDFQLGHRIARAGGRIECCRLVVDCREAPKPWHEAWAHQVRWGRTIRVCRPVPYFFSILSNTTLWPSLWVAMEGVRMAVSTAPGATRSGGWLWALGGLALCLAARIGTALDLQRRMRVPPGDRVPGWMAPLKDLLGAAVWAMALLGNTVEWRGQRYHVQRDGRLQVP